MLNFLFIMTDQLRADHTGFGGNTVVNTPHLDRLAADSRQFERAYVPHPICTPSRCAILTGRMPTVNGSWFNSIPLDWDANTFVRVLRENGYRTGHIGKSHVQDMIPGALPPGLSDVPETHTPPGEGRAVNPKRDPDWDQWEMVPRHMREWVEMPKDYYGFDHVELVCGLSVRPGGLYLLWLRRQGIDPETVGGRDTSPDAYDGWQQVYKSSVPEEAYPTPYITSRAIDFLEKSKDQEEPFYLVASYPDPHHSFSPPGRYYDMYDPDSIPLPETFNDSHEDSMPHYRDMLAKRGEDKAGPFPFSLDEDQFRKAAAAEYGMISMIDDGVGELLAALDRLNLSESTIVIFMSDHGDMFGDHGIMLKHATHYDGVIRVPLLIKAPGVTGGKTDSLAGLLDLGKTVLDLAGCSPYIGMQGHSLTPLLNDQESSVRDAVLIEEDLPMDIEGYGSNTCVRTLVTQNTRLTIYACSDHGELFDLQNDPNEMNNHFAKPEGQELRMAMMEKLTREIIDHRDLGKFPIPAETGAGGPGGKAIF